MSGKICFMTQSDTVTSDNLKLKLLIYGSLAGGSRFVVYIKIGAVVLAVVTATAVDGVVIGRVVTIIDAVVGMAGTMVVIVCGVGEGVAAEL
jgi:hypothetical protein